MDSNNITSKEWLDLAWKHFNLHAQQRVQYFNYFVVFSTILTTGFVATFQNNFQVSNIGIGIGLMQSVLSILFWKIEQRNKFLTKHAENTIRKIETVNEQMGLDTFLLFSNEDSQTQKQQEKDKHKIFIFRQFSHGHTYKIIFALFFLVGLIEAFVSYYSNWTCCK